MTRMPFITALKTSGNARAVEEFKGLILTPTVWSDIFAAGVHSQKQLSISETEYAKFIYNTQQKKSVNLGVTPACKGPSLKNHRFSC